MAEGSFLIEMKFLKSFRSFSYSLSLFPVSFKCDIECSKMLFFYTLDGLFPRSPSSANV